MVKTPAIVLMVEVVGFVTRRPMVFVPSVWQVMLKLLFRMLTWPSSQVSLMEIPLSAFVTLVARLAIVIPPGLPQQPCVVQMQATVHPLAGHCPALANPIDVEIGRAHV